MTTLSDVKDLIRQEAAADNRYGRFLDLLPKFDQRGTDPNWDLWYFSQNTDFCIESARLARDEILVLGQQFSTKQQNPEADVQFTFNDLRRKFGVLCMFLHAALESFAHEINIFYHCTVLRRKVAILRIGDSLPSATSLQAHLQLVRTNQDTQFLFEYRNAVVHGYIYPISGTNNGLFLTRTPRDEVFEFDSSGVELISFTERVFDTITDFITAGWKCFANDELVPTR